MTPSKYQHSTPSHHNSLHASQLYTKSERGSAKTRSDTPSSLPTKQRRGVPRCASSSTKAREERDSYYPSTPTRQSATINQSPETSGKSGASSRYEYADEFRKKFKTPNNMQQISKEYARNLRKIIEGNSICGHGYDRRIAAISEACEMFDHTDEGLHNIELEQGAAHALSKQLAMVSSDDDIRMICSALEMVFRGSPKFVQAAYEKMGTNFVVLLLRILSRCETGDMTNSSVSILNIWRIMTYLSRCHGLRASLCRLKGINAALTFQSPTSQPDCRIARMRFIANIAHCEDNKTLVFSSRDIFESVLRAAHFDSSDQVRHYAAITLAELASSTENQRRMVKDENLLGTLVKMIFVEKLDSTRESVITAIQNLSYAKENRLAIVSFKEGIVLEALKKTLISNSKDPKTMRRAAGALTNLASEDTCEIIGNHQGLLETLAIVSTKDPTTEVQSRAAMALTKIANGILSHMNCHGALLNALVVASLSKAPNNVAAVLRIKAREAKNRKILARHPGILDTLCDMCISHVVSRSDRDSAVRAITHLVNENSNRALMCTSAILDALTVCAGLKENDFVDARDSAIRAMERLATESSNRRFMARHPGLLAVVASAVEREAEQGDAGKRSENGSLAKPLLLSLLVAI